MDATLSTSATLCAEKLGKRFGSRAVFRDLSFQVASGSVVAIVGQNGAGKSTLLRVIAGLIRPTTGNIRWQSDEVADAHDCGLCAPDAPLYRELSALENLEFFACVRGLAWSRTQLLSHLGEFGLRARADDLAGDLSSGLRTRLGLAVAMLHQPKVLLLDEPAANLDAAGREILKRVLNNQRGRGVALVATNDSREAETYDAKIAVEARNNEARRNEAR